jgi:DNA invertase Pin-like site-specific DNA recombinase
MLVVTRLDRLARSTRDLLNALDTIGKAGAGFKSLADSWADTTTADGHGAGRPRGIRTGAYPCSHK